jgi:cell division initiation protein
MLTPLDIQNKSFQSKMRGYNPDEVDDFLDQVIRDYEQVLARQRELEKQVKHYGEKLEYFNELKNALNQSIIVAQETADKVKTNADHEAQVIVTSAESKANDLLTNAQNQSQRIMEGVKDKAESILMDSVEKAKRLIDETDDLKRQTRVFHQRLSLILESQLNQVKSVEWDDLLKPFVLYSEDSEKLVGNYLRDEFGLDTALAKADISVTKSEHEIANGDTQIFNFDDNEHEVLKEVLAGGDDTPVALADTTSFDGPLISPDFAAQTAAHEVKPLYDTQTFDAPLIEETPAAPVFEAPAPAFEETPIEVTPAFETPVFEAPTYEAPAEEVAAEPAQPHFDLPVFEAPATAPTFDTGAFEVPSFEVPTFETPNFTAPEIEAPTFDNLTFDTSNIEIPEFNPEQQ